MKKIVILFLIAFCPKSNAQTTRYFEFRLPMLEFWQDTSFVAAANDANLINEALSELSLPFANRRHISGFIDFGNEGYNRNNSHWFQWHFKTNEWFFSQISTEVCDGRPYADLDLDTNTWVTIVTQYCPWQSKIVRELFPNLNAENPVFKPEFAIVPNPSSGQFTIRHNALENFKIEIYSTAGQKVFEGIAEDQSYRIIMPNCAQGVYLAKIYNANNTYLQKVIVNSAPE